jgi:hypothetical protein
MRSRFVPALATGRAVSARLPRRIRLPGLRRLRHWHGAFPLTADNRLTAFSDDEVMSYQLKCGNHPAT